MLRTLGNFDTLHGFVIYRRGTLLDELVSLNADIKDLGTLHGKVHKLLYDIVHNVCSGLQRS